MSLLLDARKKSLQAQAAQHNDNASSISGQSRKTEDANATTGHEGEARTAGQILFAAKSLPSLAGRFNRKPLFSMAGTILLLGSGAIYLWLGNSANDTTPQTVTAPPAPAASLAPAPAEQIGLPAMPDKPETLPPPTPKEAEPALVAQRQESPPPSPIRIEQKLTEQVEPLLMDAYQSYRRGKLGEAQRLYLEMYRMDAQNVDALLGLAAIAQQRGELKFATQYYFAVLALDPRNATANAGLASLNQYDGNIESRLKLLLREQGNSAVLHFALGNLYAGQSRWGEAQQAYFNAVTLEPGNAEFAYNLAVSLDHLGQARLSAEHYRHALQLDPLHSAGFDHAQVSRRIDDLTH